MINVTILTPSYNRSDLIKKTYESLLAQTSYSFEWLIIDDGSNDDTEKVVNEFINENIITIVYKKKPNGGKHTALNYSHPYISGEYVIVLDDDDRLTPDAVKTIIETWEKYKTNSKIGCLSFVKGRSETEPLNTWIPKQTIISNHIDYRINNNRGGDCCEVVRTDLFKKYPFPEFKDEKFLGESHLWMNIAYNYDTVYLNKILYICDYLEGGLTKAGKKMRLSNPNGGMYNCSLYFDKRVCFKQQLKHSILYDCYAFASKKVMSKIFKSKKKMLCFVSLPIGLYLYKKWNK